MSLSISIEYTECTDEKINRYKEAENGGMDIDILANLPAYIPT